MRQIYPAKRNLEFQNKVKNSKTFYIFMLQKNQHTEDCCVYVNVPWEMNLNVNIHIEEKKTYFNIYQKWKWKFIVEWNWEKQNTTEENEIP